jgi:sensor histidine kinase regulating citrate/malate metabolism
MSLASRLLVLQVITVTLLVVGFGVFSVRVAQGDAEHSARAQVVAAATTVARTPSVVNALSAGGKSGTGVTAALQDWSVAVGTATGVDFVVVMTPRGIRFTHPNPTLIGQEFHGGLGAAPSGTTYTEIAAGTLGPSMRAVVPVFDAAHAVIGLVAVGITTTKVSERVFAQLPLFIGLIAVGLLYAVVTSLLVRRWLTARTFGLGEKDLASMYRERTFTQSLRAAAHESANRLHTVISLVEIGQYEKAIAFATDELASAQQLTDQLMGQIEDPVIAAVLLGKSGQAYERGVEFTVTADSAVAVADLSLPAADVVTILGNLIDNALDSVLDSSPRWITVDLRPVGAEVVIRVADSGPGVPPELVDSIFTSGFSTKTGSHRGIGLSLVRDTVEGLGGTIAVDSGAGGMGAVFTVRLPRREGRQT